MQNTWITDENGNRASVEYWGSEEAARKSLANLKECRNCSNCSDCSRCSGCSGCSDCSDCSGCSGCSGCSDCSGCSGCSGCSDCSRCSGCSGCSRCSDLVNVHSGIKPSAEVPRIEGIHQKVYAAVTGAPNALEMSTWHACGSTHCRGGWVVTLAGDAGKALEMFHGTLLAAQLIYRESGSPINPARFFDSNEDALADMKRLAEEEAARG